MRKQILLSAFAILFGLSTAFAQGGGGFQRQTPEERTKAAMEKMAPLQLNEDQAKKTETVLLDLFTEQQKYMDEMRASGNMDREAMQAKRKELADKRDLKFKEIFTEEQMKKFKEEVEPSMRPQRRPEGGQ